MELLQWQLDTLHQKQLGILKEIQRICEANDIDYFAIAGTLLGAVRHDGFIPWDDDIDLGMMRSDYCKFVESAKQQLHPNFFLQTCETDPGFGLPMAKIRLNDTKLIEGASVNVNCHQGIFVDIFPFDEKPDAPMRRWFHAMSSYVLKRALLARTGYAVGAQKNMILRLAFSALIAVLSLIPTESLVQLFERQMKQFNGSDNTECVTVAGSYGYRRESFQRSWADDLVDFEFEGLKIRGFRDADTYLSKLYGDYLQLPAENERGQRHDIRAIDFGD
ncbi:LicD family protein [Pseudarthrobacter oxydans]|uniref:LicD family protein n=1 Tax=Pseudarthrobacter oxydans TaxID=1671 RepID=UPI00341B105B